MSLQPSHVFAARPCLCSPAMSLQARAIPDAAALSGDHHFPRHPCPFAPCIFFNFIQAERQAWSSVPARCSRWIPGGVNTAIHTRTPACLSPTRPPHTRTHAHTHAHTHGQVQVEWQRGAHVPHAVPAFVHVLLYAVRCFRHWISKLPICKVSKLVFKFGSSKRVGDWSRVVWPGYLQQCFVCQISAAIVILGASNFRPQGTAVAQHQQRCR